MMIINEIQTMRRYLQQLANQSIGFVPTMGFLHEGHLSLVRQCKQENEQTVVSIFVNPIQFAPNEDLQRYPRDLQRDRQLLEQAGVDVLFLPSVEEMYPAGFKTGVQVKELGAVLCGKSRPSHFDGVTTVVLKLFNIVNPARAYFGQKDAQQAIILKRMAADLNCHLQIKVMPIIREPDGLALSSRNTYLSPKERKSAGRISAALKKADQMIQAGENQAETIVDTVIQLLKNDPAIKIDYVEMVSLSDLQPLSEVLKADTLLAVAVYIGRTRLIDNFILGEI
jgi:pantoate--beta-alanine ligase